MSILLLHTRPLLSPRFPLFLRAVPKVASRSRALRYTTLGLAGLGVSAFLSPSIHFQSRPSTPAPDNASSRPATPPPSLHVPVDDAKPPPPPESVFAPIELSFGLVCGAASAVFIKKGLRIVAFTLGGIFVLLQYLSINSVIRVDWDHIGSKFESLFYRTDPVTNKKHPPTIGSLWNWLVNFLATDFQPRASFIAGLALGFRFG